MAVTVTHELGIPITCDEDGWFEAFVYDTAVREKSLPKVRKAIRAAKPHIRAVSCRYSGDLEMASVCAVEGAKDGKPVFVSANADRWRGRYTDLREWDEAAVAEYKNLKRMESDEDAAISRKYLTMRVALIERLPLLTVERFEELVRAELEKRNGG